MQRLRIGPRLSIAFAIIVVLMSLGSGVALWQYRAVRGQAERLQQVNQQALSVLVVHNRILTISDDLSRVAESQDAAQFEEVARPFKQALVGEIQLAVDHLKITPEDARQNALDITHLESIARRLPEQIDAMIKQAQADDWVSLGLRLHEQLKRASQTTGQVVESINENVAAEREQVAEKMQASQTQALLAILSTGGLALFSAIYLGLALTRSIARPLSELDAAAQQLAGGEFSYRVEVAGEDEIAHVGRAFNHAATELAELYTNLEALVQQRTEELQYRALQLETSIAVGQSIISILDLDTLLREVAAMVKERYSYYYVGISLVNEEGTHLVARASAGGVGPQALGRRFRLGSDENDVISGAVRLRKPVVLNQITKPIPNRPADARAMVAFPLEMGGQVLGVLDIQSDQAEHFKAEDLPVLQLLANEVAIAIHNASLYQAEKSRRNLAETLYSVGRALSGTLDLSEVLQLILEHLQEIVPYDRGALLLRKGEILDFAAARGFPEGMDVSQWQVATRGNDVYQEIVHSMQALSIPDIAQRPDWQQMKNLPDTCAWLGVPLIRSNQVIGMLSLARETPDPYADDEVTLASAFAGQAAIALENAQLYERITRFNQQLEQRVQERTVELRHAYAKLERLDRAKTDFIGVVSHELRTPLTVMRGYSGMLLQDRDIERNELHHRAISGIHDGTMRLYEIVNTMLDMVKVDSEALSLAMEPVMLRWVIDNVARGFKDALTERNLTLTMADSLAELPKIQGDTEGLQKVFYHLLMNAIKYTPDGGVITVSGRILDADASGLGQESVEVVLTDAGIGIEAESLELIFEKFYQTGQVALHSSGKTKFKAGGPGLGLAIVRGILTAHGGKAWAESAGHDEENYPGSQFHVLLPVQPPNSPLLMA